MTAEQALANLALTLAEEGSRRREAEARLQQAAVQIDEANRLVAERDARIGLQATQISELQAQLHRHLNPPTT